MTPYTKKGGYTLSLTSMLFNGFKSVLGLGGLNVGNLIDNGIGLVSGLNQNIYDKWLQNKLFERDDTSLDRTMEMYRRNGLNPLLGLPGASATNTKGFEGGSMSTNFAEQKAQNLQIAQLYLQNKQAEQSLFHQKEQFNEQKRVQAQKDAWNKYMSKILGSDTTMEVPNLSPQQLATFIAVHTGRKVDEKIKNVFDETTYYNALTEATNNNTAGREEAIKEAKSKTSDSGSYLKEDEYAIKPEVFNNRRKNDGIELIYARHGADGTPDYYIIQFNPSTGKYEYRVINEESLIDYYNDF